MKQRVFPRGIIICCILMVLSIQGGIGCSDRSGTPVSLISIAVTPHGPSTSPGTTRQFTAMGTYSNSSTLDLTASATWSSSNTGVATIDSTGLAAANASGSTTITASSGNIAGTAVLTVTDMATESPFGFHPAKAAKIGYPDSGHMDAENIGIKWTRPVVYAFWFLVQPDLSVQQYDFSFYDQQYGEVPEGMQILANIAPQGNLDEGYCLPGSYLPINTDKYVLFVKATVERYDGDGIDDMQGLTNPIKYWQVGNEPGTAVASDFDELQRVTYTAIKAACPDCLVMIGGVPGMPPAASYIMQFNDFYKPILDALGGQYVDIMDIHWYGNATGDYRGVKIAYDHIRSVLTADGFPDTLPVWITEMGSYSGDPAVSDPRHFDYPPQTERQQALDYFKRFIYPLSFGVKKIFPAFGLMEGMTHDNTYFDHTGLIYDGLGSGDAGLGVKKLGYFAHKKMTEVLEGSDWNSIETIRESGDVYVYKFMKNGRPIYVAWWDYFNDVTYTPGKTIDISLSGLAGSAVSVMEALPGFMTGAEVADYDTAFTKAAVAITDGTAVITLGDSPAFVEPVSPLEPAVR